VFQNPARGAGQKNNSDASNSTRRVLDLDGPRPPQRTKSATLMTEDMFRVFRKEKDERRGTPGMSTTEELAQKDMQSDYMRQMPRRFEVGDVYAPHDLSPVEMRKWRRWTTEKHDLVDLLALRPVDMYRVSLLGPVVFCHPFSGRRVERMLTQLFSSRTSPSSLNI
jgi:hypothetical protein